MEKKKGGYPLVFETMEDLEVFLDALAITGQTGLPIYEEEED